MDRRTFLAAATTLLATSAVAQDGNALQTTLETLRASAGIPALGGAVVTPDGLAWSGASGVRALAGTEAVELSDRWHLGSNTKAMTTALYARLVEQGRAHWGVSVAELFPDIAADPAWGAVTVEQLMGHRAGILDPEVMPIWMMAASMGGTNVTGGRTSLTERVLQSPPAGSVTAFSYSNAGYILLGAAIERITGQSWEQTIRDEVFEPLGMMSAGFGAPTGDEPWGHRGAGLTPIDPARPDADNPPALGPAGTVHAAMADYARFLRVFLMQGGGWLSSDSLSRLTTPLPGEGQPYALGWGVAPDRPWAGGRPVLIHDGSNTLWLARAVVAPGRQAAIICVANAADPARPAIDGLTRALVAALPEI